MVLSHNRRRLRLVIVHLNLFFNVFTRLTAFLDYTRMLAYLASFGYTHQENEPSLQTAITGIGDDKKQTIETFQVCRK